MVCASVHTLFVSDTLLLRLGIRGLYIRRIGSVGRVCVVKNTAVLNQRIFKMLGWSILILGKTPTKSGEPCVECNGHAFQLASLLIRVMSNTDT